MHSAPAPTPTDDTAEWLTVFACGPEPKPADHTCDLKGPQLEVEQGLISATCSQCGRAAFDPWDVW